MSMEKEKVEVEHKVNNHQQTGTPTVKVFLNVKRDQAWSEEWKYPLQNFPQKVTNK